MPSLFDSSVDNADSKRPNTPSTFSQKFLRFLGWKTHEISVTYSIFHDIFVTVDVLEFDRNLTAGKPFSFDIRISNPENGLWPEHGIFDIHLRWTTPQADGTDTLLAESWTNRIPCLNPGESHRIRAVSTMPENSPAEVFAEFYVSSLEGVWRKGIGRETRFHRTVNPGSTLGLPKDSQDPCNKSGILQSPRKPGAKSTVQSKAT